MDLKLNSLKLENFKGIKKFEMQLNGASASIKAENGVGKTTVYDAYLWLLFGKNAEGKAAFGYRPFDDGNQPIKGVVTAVEAEIEIDGVIHTLRKESHEKVIKRQVRGYESVCTIDEVPKQLNEFNSYVSEMVSEDTFKLLTDLTYFCEKLHWAERRKVLFEIAGEIGTPEGFEALTSELNNRTIEEYKTVLTKRKKAYKVERGEINPRIDEINTGLGEVGNIETAPAIEQRDSIEAEISELDKQERTFLEGTGERQKKVDIVNNLKGDLAILVARLSQGDSTKVLPIQKEKNDWEKKSADYLQDKRVAENAIRTSKNTLEDRQGELKRSQDKIQLIRGEYKEVEASKPGACPTCKRDMPVEDFEQTKKLSLAGLASKGKTLRKEVNELKSLCENAEKNYVGCKDDLEKAESKCKDFEALKVAEFEKLDKKISEARKGVKPETDDEWIRLNNKIEAANEDVGESFGDKMLALGEQKTELREKLDELNRVLNSADRFEKDKERIAVLEAREQELAQLIADIEESLAGIDDYVSQESELIEKAVNGKFKHVKWSLFKEILNGGIEERCEATFNGVPYADMSTGQQIYIGIDILNVLAVNYGIGVPLFIDHAESMTMPIESKCQTIKLAATPNRKKLKVEVDTA